MHARGMLALNDCDNRICIKVCHAVSDCVPCTSAQYTRNRLIRNVNGGYSELAEYKKVSKW